jgi:hypothetical protein
MQCNSLSLLEFLSPYPAMRPAFQKGFAARDHVCLGSEFGRYFKPTFVCCPIQETAEDNSTP